jgi:cysteine synthase/rhodanese-related sulfurtransferase
LQSAPTDSDLLRRFDAEVWERLPHADGGRVKNPTQLIEVTDLLLDCAKSEYGMDLDGGGVRVFAKLDSKIHGGSVKMRPAAMILRDAITRGGLRRGQAIFEATSGNFGIALGFVRTLGVDVVALVSRRLQDGVVKQLKSDGVRLVNLDIDICPAPGFKGDADLLVAKGVAAGVRQQLEELGFDPSRFERVRAEAEGLLARQDAIGLAKLLARAYDGFCPEQYDNALNVEVHRNVTGPEIDQQLAEVGTSLARADLICAFGTGGTAGGLGRYISSKHGRKGVRVVFPLKGQDVAGIRTKEKAEGLRFYEPESYLGDHEVDFDGATRVFEYFNRHSLDIGESGALGLYACLQLLNYGAGKEFVVMVADGSAKYLTEVKAVARKGKRDQVRLEEAASSIDDYSGVVWAHNMFIPKGEGVRLIASSLGCDVSAVKVANVRDVQTVLNGGEPSDEFEGLLPKDGRPMLVVCMAGNTSLMLARVLERRGVAAESLVGGITGLPDSRGRRPFDLVEMARG